MKIDILIEVYEYEPHGHGDVYTIDDFIDVSDETYHKIKEYYENGIDDLESMHIAELKSIISEIKEEHINFAQDRFSMSGDDDEDFCEPDITIKIAEGEFEED